MPDWTPWVSDIGFLGDFKNLILLYNIDMKFQNNHNFTPGSKDMGDALSIGQVSIKSLTNVNLDKLLFKNMKSSLKIVLNNRPVICMIIYFWYDKINY